MIHDIGTRVNEWWCLILNEISHAITTVTAHMVLVDRMRLVPGTAAVRRRRHR